MPTESIERVLILLRDSKYLDRLVENLGTIDTVAGLVSRLEAGDLSVLCHELQMQVNGIQPIKGLPVPASAQMLMGFSTW